MILAFDQAPRFIGFAYGEPGATPVRGIHENPDYGENTARLGKHVREWALTLIKSTGASRIYFEQILVRKTGLHLPTLHKQFKVAGAIETAAEMAGLADDCFEVDIADWRREFYAGNRPGKNVDSLSTAWKDLAKLECMRRGWLVDDHNVAEACGIWVFGCMHTDKRVKSQERVAARRRELNRWNGEAA